MSKIIPIILSGGAGARLWPISRSMQPKPFMEVAGKSLVEHALERAASIANEALIVSNQDHYFLTENVLKNMPKAPKVSYLLEPMGRNTAPAIALAVRHIQKVYGEDAVCLVLAADHLISDNQAFEKAVASAADQARAGYLVVFGIRPTAPETGYGYLEVAKTGDNPQLLKSFIEKPDKKTAEQFLAEGRYYWNAGIFCFTAGVMAAEMATHAADLWAASETAFEKARYKIGVTHFEETSFIAQPEISIDYAVMEKSKKVFMVPAFFGWSDVGSWDAVAKSNNADINGNIIVGSNNVHFSDSSSNYVESESHVNKILAMVGVDNLAVIDTPDSLLVLDRNKSQDVKKVLDGLKESNISKFTQLPPIVKKPWGSYTTLNQGIGYQVKKIIVLPEQKLSLQLHHQREEHWLILQGEAIVQIGEKEFKTGPSQYRHIPVGQKHRLTNIGEKELILIEVQIGDYLGEDDIVRFEDIYGRINEE